MDTEGERIRYYIDQQGVSVRSFCANNNIGYSGFHQVLQNSRNLGMIVLKQIIEAYPNLNLNWLLTGRGSVEIDPEATGAIRAPQPIYGNIDPGLEAFLKYFDNPITIKKINEIIDLKLKENESN